MSLSGCPPPQDLGAWGPGLPPELGSRSTKALLLCSSPGSRRRLLLRPPARPPGRVSAPVACRSQVAADAIRSSLSQAGWFIHLPFACPVMLGSSVPREEEKAAAIASPSVGGTAPSFFLLWTCPAELPSASQIGSLKIGTFNFWGRKESNKN